MEKLKHGMVGEKILKSLQMSHGCGLSVLLVVMGFRPILVCHLMVLLLMLIMYLDMRSHAEEKYMDVCWRGRRKLVHISTGGTLNSDMQKAGM
jgi:uncharacterized membrane protein YjgN (DUF898 family)